MWQRRQLGRCPRAAPLPLRAAPVLTRRTCPVAPPGPSPRRQRGEGFALHHFIGQVGRVWGNRPRRGRTPTGGWLSISAHKASPTRRTPCSPAPPQAPCLVTEEGEWAADYVVRTENLAEDMRGVSAEAGRGGGGGAGGYRCLVCLHRHNRGGSRGRGCVIL